ncbi:hypothetical protein Tco_0849662 [Tanacetum coccineum]
MDSIASKEKITKHSEVGSWFHELKPACNSFMSDERLVWISIKGLPIKAFTRNTFAKIVSSWGELINVEDSDNTSMSYKQLCVKIKSYFIIESEESSSDDESECQEEVQKSGNYVNDFEPDNENDIDHVSELSCMHMNDLVFTPDVVEENVAEKNSDELSQPKNDFLDANVGVSTDNNGSCNFLMLKASGSILEVMDELIKVGQIIGLGSKAKKYWLQELNTKHKVNFVGIQETKMDKIDLFSIKALWGNFSFDYAFSPAVGYSGGILCA